MSLLPSGRRLTVLLVGLAVGLLAVGAATGLPGMAVTDQPSGDEILDAVETQYDSAETVAGTATVTVSNDSDSTTATVEYAAKSPNKVAYMVNKNGETYEAGSNGSVGWAVGADQAYARELPTESEFTQYEPTTDPVPESNVTATLVETTDLDGESAYVIELTPTADSETDVTGTLWVGTEDNRVLQATATDGTNETTVQITETQFNVSIHDSTFEPPADRVSLTTSETYETFAEVSSATELSIPQYPDGEFTEATQVSNADGQAVVQRYETTDGTVSVITATGAASYLDQLDSNATVSVNGQTATAVEREGRATVFWTTENTTTGVAVTGSIEDATEAAQKI